MLNETSSPLSPDSRRALTSALDARVSDGVDLYTQVKSAHWNVKGPLFAPLHELFDALVGEVASGNDDLAERAIALGGVVHGTARRAAQASRLDELPESSFRGLDLARLIVQRLTVYAVGLRETRDLAAQLGDPETTDLLTERVAEMEKRAWFLHATLHSD